MKDVKFKVLVAKEVLKVLKVVRIDEDYPMDVTSIEDMLATNVNNKISIEEARAIVLQNPNVIANFIANECRMYGVDYNGVEIKDIKTIVSSMMSHTCGEMLYDMLGDEYGDELTYEMRGKIIKVLEMYISIS